MLRVLRSKFQTCFPSFQDDVFALSVPRFLGVPSSKSKSPTVARVVCSAQSAACRKGYFISPDTACFHLYIPFKMQLFETKKKRERMKERRYKAVCITFRRASYRITNRDELINERRRDRQCGRFSRERQPGTRRACRCHQGISGILPSAR